MLPKARIWLSLLSRLLPPRFARRYARRTLPKALVSNMRKKQFWSDWLWVTTDERLYPELRDARVPFLAAAGSPTLWLGIGPALESFSLELQSDGDPELLGFDGTAHWQPHVLRWTEVEALARSLALSGELPHPGPVVALLSRFAPICQGDDVDAIFPVLVAALRACGAPAESIEAFLPRIDRRAAGFFWKSDGHRWTIHQSDVALQRTGIALYSLRTPENSSFPHEPLGRFLAAATRTCAQAIEPRWRTKAVLEQVERFAEGNVAAAPLLAAALREAGCTHAVILEALAAPVDRARAAWVVELIAGGATTDSPLGSVTGRHFGPTTHVAVERHTISVGAPAGEAIERVRRAIQREFGVRDCGGMFDEDLEPIEIHWELGLEGDLEANLRALEAVLRKAGAPAKTKLRWFDIDWESRELGESPTRPS